MNLNEFCENRPYLYHLTDQRNFDNIVKNRCLFSTNRLISTLPENERLKIQREKRFNHIPVNDGQNTYHIRDQKPLNLKLLERALEDCTESEYIEYLNDHVFFWAIIKGGLESHYNTYKHESPIILRFPTSEIIRLNPNPKFTRLNSGGLRAIPKYAGYFKGRYYGGNAPSRGLNTFKEPDEIDRNFKEVKEVTFRNHSILPNHMEYSYHLADKWTPCY